MPLDATVSGASSDSYVTHEEFETYRDALGWTDSADDTTDEQNLRRATQSLDRIFEWDGYPTDQDQALQWPRVTDRIVDGRTVASDTIPQRIKDAQCEMAYLIQNGLDPFKTISGSVKVAGAGPARVEFFGAPGVPRMVAIEGLIDPYLAVGSGAGALIMARG